MTKEEQEAKLAEFSEILDRLLKPIMAERDELKAEVERLKLAYEPKDSEVPDYEATVDALEAEHAEVEKLRVRVAELEDLGKKAVLGFDAYCGLTTPDYDDFMDSFRMNLGLPWPDERERNDT